MCSIFARKLKKNNKKEKCKRHPTNCEKSDWRFFVIISNKLCYNNIINKSYYYYIINYQNYIINYFMINYFSYFIS